MGVQLDNDFLRSLLEQAACADDPDERRAGQDRLVTYLFESESLQVWGRGLAKLYRRPNDHEDVTQVVTEAVISYVRQITPETCAAIDGVAAHLYFKAKAAVVQWVDSPAVTVASEMSGISRRYRQSRAAHSEFVSKFSREPSDAELVDYINTKVIAARKDAAKQGALVTEADVSGRMLQAYSMDYQPSDGDGEGEGYGSPTQDDTVTARGDLAITVRRLADIADQTFPDTSEPTVREVLAVWMDFVLQNEPPTVSAVASALGITRAVARERVTQVDSVLAMLRESNHAQH